MGSFRWCMEEVVCTRRGKQHTVKADDPALRRVRWWEWFLFRQRFPSPAAQPELAVENQEQGTEAGE